MAKKERVLSLEEIEKRISDYYKHVGVDYDKYLETGLLNYKPNDKYIPNLTELQGFVFGVKRSRQRWYENSKRGEEFELTLTTAKNIMEILLKKDLLRQKSSAHYDKQGLMFTLKVNFDNIEKIENHNINKTLTIVDDVSISKDENKN